MDTVLEQFIASDKSKKTSDMFRVLGIILFIIGVLIFVASNIIGIASTIAGVTLYITSYFMYIDYEYEIFEGNITVSKIYRASKRKLVQKIDRDSVKRAYITSRKDAFKNGVKAYYNSNLEELTLYTFELPNNKVVQLALNKKLSELVDIYYRQKIMQ